MAAAAHLEGASTTALDSGRPQQGPIVGFMSGGRGFICWVEDWQAMCRKTATTCHASAVCWTLYTSPSSSRQPPGWVPLSPFYRKWSVGEGTGPKLQFPNALAPRPACLCLSSHACQDAPRLGGEAGSPPPTGQQLPGLLLRALSVFSPASLRGIIHAPRTQAMPSDLQEAQLSLQEKCVVLRHWPQESAIRTLVSNLGQLQFSKPPPPPPSYCA